MCRTRQITSLSITAALLCLLSFMLASPGMSAVDLKITGQTMSADLQGVSLGLVLETLKKEKGIWVRGDEYLLKKRVYVKFSDLPLQKAMSRILARTNYVLVFDHKNQLAGLLIFEKKDFGTRLDRDDKTFIESPFFPHSQEEVSDSENPSEEFSKNPSSRKSQSKTAASTRASDPFLPEDPFSAMSQKDEEDIIESSARPENPFVELFDETDQ